MSAIEAYGITVDVPPGWEGRIFKRQQAGELRAAEVPGPSAPMGELTLPVVHVATVALPADIADYGSDVVGDLGPSDALVVVKEFGPESVGQALFARPGIPRVLSPDDFSPSTLQRTIAGQAGVQIFFEEAGRPFCVYVVLGDYNRRHEVVPAVNQVLATITVVPDA
jgi:hypothetical protein